MKKIKKNRKNRGRKIDEKNNDGNSFAGGFTLIEILMVMGIIALLAAVVIVAINPARQFAQARNSQRISNVNSILNAVGQNIADHRGIFECGAGVLPTTATTIKSGGGVGGAGGGSAGYDLAECITPLYLPAMPFDPSAPDAHFTSSTDYDTGYTIFQDATTGRITVAAPFAQNSAELEEEIEATR